MWLLVLAVLVILAMMVLQEVYDDTRFYTRKQWVQTVAPHVLGLAFVGAVVVLGMS